MKKFVKEKNNIVMALVCIITMIATLFMPFTVMAVDDSAGIVIDGDIDDWEAMGRTLASELTSLEWKFAKSEDGSMLYFYFAGPVMNQWDGAYDWRFLQFKVGDTTMGMHLNYMADVWMYPGAQVVRKSTATASSAGVCVYEGALPISTDDYTIMFEGTNLAAADVPVFIANNSEDIEAVYEGIVIDGRYYDWAAVAKTDTGEEEDALNGLDCLSQVACIFDGDYVYIYLKDGEIGTAANAGTHSNGRYSIVTDTGRTLTFEVNIEEDGSVSGVSGATAAHYAGEWEIAIPASALPYYIESISFGLYQQEPYVEDVVDIQGGEGSAGEFSDIVYDGMFGDWNAYPHTLIQYATAGTQTNTADGEGALYKDGNILYGHVLSSMDAHLAEAGGEFASAISIYFNGDHEFNGTRTNNLYPFLVAVAEDGTITWDPQTENLDNGTYEFYIADARSEFDRNSITNISQLADHEQFFGKMLVNISDTCDEIEFYIDLEQVAAYLSYYSGTTIEASDFKMVEAQFGRIGQEILSISGTSSGPFVGVAICVTVVLAGVLVKRRRNKAVA